MTASRNRVVDLRRKKPGGEQAREQRVLSLPESARPKRRSLRSRRRKLQLWLSGMLLCLLAALVWLVSYASYLPQYNVQTITVQGASHVPSPAISAFADSSIHPQGHPFFSPSNIFLYGPGRLAKAIGARFPWIEKTTVRRESLFSTHVLISVVERNPFALWCLSPDATSTPCYELDKTGYIFAPIDPTAAATRATSYVFSGGLPTQADLASPIGDTFAPNKFGGVLAFLQYLSLDGFAPLGASVVSDTDYTVPLASGLYLKASFGEDPEQLVKNVELILGSDPLKGMQDKLLYLDLRFGDRVYYKLKTLNGAQPAH